MFGTEKKVAGMSDSMSVCLCRIAPAVKLNLLLFWAFFIISLS